MNAQEAMKKLALDNLKRQLRDGSLTPDEMSRRLSRAIDDEIARGPARMDTDLIAACEQLLWQLHAPQTSVLPAGRRKAYPPMLGRTPRAKPRWLRPRVAGLALAFLCMVGIGGLALRYSAELRGRRPVTLSQGTRIPVAETARLSVTLAATVAPTVAFTDWPTSPPVTPSPTPEPTPLVVTAEPLVVLPPAPTQQPRARYVTVQQLRQEAPQRWQATYSTLGRRVEVDAPIVIPQVDAVPLVELQWLLHDGPSLERALRPLFPQAAVVDVYTHNEGRSLSVSVQRSENSLLMGPRQPSARVRVMPGQPAQASDYSADAPLKLLKRLVTTAQGDTEGIRLLDQAGTTGWYPYRTWRGNEQPPRAPYGFLQDRGPVEGYERGHYLLRAAQVFEGIPLLPFEGQYSPEDQVSSVEGYIYLEAYDDSEFRLSMQLLRQTGIRAADLPLVSFDTLRLHLEQLIEKGWLRAVDRIELGYTLYYAQPVSPGKEEQHATLLAVPVWRVLGLLMDNLEQEPEAYVLTSRLEAPYVEYRAMEADMRFNAQTGEYMEHFVNRMANVNPAVLTWEQMEGEGEVSLLDQDR